MPISKILKTIFKIIFFPLYLLAFLGDTFERIFSFGLSILLIFLVFRSGDLNIFIKIFMTIMAIACFLVAIGKEDKNGGTE